MSPAGFWIFTARAQHWINTPVVLSLRLLSTVLDIVFAAAAVKK